MKALPCIIAGTIPLIQAQIPAFPGAEGFGAYATGGRGGDVYIVTNLNSSGMGSFAQGLATVPAAGRTIVFEVSGYIPIIPRSLKLASPKVTIAGQTAPGDGVGLRDSAFEIAAPHVIIRHLRFRHGFNERSADCLNIDGSASNCLLDQISIQFSTDENMSSFNTRPDLLTLQWSLNAWGLVPHSAGGLWDQNRATCHHTLWAHNHTRDPKSQPDGLLEWINNVTFDYGIGFIMGDSTETATWRANVINSYFINPPGNIRPYIISRASLDANGVPNYSLYLNGCLTDRNANNILDGTDTGYSLVTGDYHQSPTPHPNTGSLPVTLDSPTIAYKKLVSKSGALRLDVTHAGPLRDEVDTRLIENLVNQIGSRITSEAELAGISNGGMGTLASTPAAPDTDRDGMPDDYEMALGWNPAAQDHNTALPASGGTLSGVTFFPPATVAGYGRLEEYLYFKSIPHGKMPASRPGAPTSLAVDLKRYTSGFSAAPVFTISQITGGTVTLGGEGNSIATFTPTVGHSGRARFDFTVTDAAGHSWTQTCAILVTTAGIPGDLKWKGAGPAWDTTSQNWLRQPGGETTTYADGDRTIFDAGGLAQPAVSIAATQFPAAVVVDASGDYTFNGAGSLTSSGELSKRGAGQLTLSTFLPNNFAAAVVEAGTLSITADTALGSTPITLAGGTFDLGGRSPVGSPIHVSAPSFLRNSGATARIAAVTGTADLTVTQSAVLDLGGSLAGYSGTFVFTGTAPVRFNGSVGGPATFDLRGTTDLNKRSTATTIDIGGLAGIAGTTLRGATGSTTATTYSVGSNGASTTFAGTIADGGGPTTLSKTGSGTLTLSGANTYTGGLTVTAGRVDLLGNQSTASGSIDQRASGTHVFVGSIAQISPTSIEVAAGHDITVGESIASGTGNRTFEIYGNEAFPTTVTNHGAFFAGRASLVRLRGGASWQQNGAMTIEGVGGYGASVTLNSGNLGFTYAGPSPIAINPAPGNTGSATLTLGGGTFTTSRGFSFGASTSTGVGRLVFSGGGMLLLSGNIPELVSGATSGVLQIGTGGAVIDTNGFSTSIGRSLANVSGQTGSLVKQGAGNLTLLANHSYSGTTTVSAGELSFSGGNMASAITVRDGTILGLAVDSPVVSSKSLTLESGARIRVNGPPTLAEHTLFTGTSISGTPQLESAVPGYILTLAGNALKLVPGTTYAAWAQANGASDQAIDEDHDADGVANGIEYFMGESGTSFTRLPVPDASATVTWPMAAGYPGVYETNYFIQVSENLTNWSDVPAAQVIVTPGVSVSHTLSGPGERFVRLKVLAN
jgi:autotransporter-associated beta strand protein